MSMKIGDIAFREIQRLDLPTLINSMSDEYTVVVPEDLPAIEVINRIEPEDTSLIVCINDQGSISGVVVPTYVNRAISDFHSRPETPLPSTISFMIVNAIEQSRGFHHETINTRVMMFLCSDGPHYTAGDPCPKHHIPTTPATF